MVDTKLSERPNRPGFAMEAYDVLTTMDNKWLAAEEIYSLLPDAVRRKHKSRKKLQVALTAGVERGLFVFVGSSKGNRTDKKYRVATKEHRERMLKTYNQRMMKYPSMAKSESPRTEKKKGNTVNGERARSDMVRMIDAEIAVTEERLARLERMRNDALALG